METGYKRILIEITELSDEGYKYKLHSVTPSPLRGTPPEAGGGAADEPVAVPTGILKEILSETQGVEGDGPIEGCMLWLVVHPMEDFLNAGDRNQGDVWPLAQDLLEYKQGIRDKEEKVDGGLGMYPVLHVTTTSIMLPAIYTTKPLHRLVPRNFLIVDDSIWNYHVSIFEPDEIKALLKRANDEIVDFVTDQLLPFRRSFHDALESIVRNYERHLYHLQVAKEYADLNARISAQSYLTGAHANGVSPFVFHSEGFIKMMITHEFEKGKTQITERKWRFLLVDDKATQPMGHKPDLKGEVNGHPWNCKLTIIEKTLRHYFEWEVDDRGKLYSRPWNSESKVPEDCCILIEYVETLRDAEQAMKEKMYDIVLLDYLLDRAEDQNYGYSLLNDIHKDINNNTNAYKAGPSERFFFMFISAYTTAVYERLRAETLNLSEDFWHVSLGACPTNTPQLFLYNLLTLMSKRLKDSGLLNLSAQRIGELMSEIYHDASGGNAVRRKANKRYEKVLSLHYHYRKVMKDVAIPTSNSVFDSKGSVLMTEFAQKNQNMGGLLEHMANLVHITAFGTIRQWPEMWEEYLYFKALYEQMPGEKKQEVFGDIERYILDLKRVQG